MSANKRSNAFGQGRKGQEYDEERPDDPADEPKRATAAQLATRKIKTLKGARRPAGVTSGLSAFNSPNPPSTGQFGLENGTPSGNATGGFANPFANMSQAQPPSILGGSLFGQSQQQGTPAGAMFGQSQPQSTPIFGQLQQQSTPAGSMFGQPQQQNTPGASLFGGAFGSNTTSSFPPAQPSTPSNIGANSSFPPFGGNNSSNTAPMSAFSSKVDTNFGNTATTFSASPAPNGSMFNSQSTQQQGTNTGQDNTLSTKAPNDFSFLGASTAAKSETSKSVSLFGNNTTSTPGPSGGLFDKNATPKSAAFGGFGAPSSTAAPASPFPNAFPSVSGDANPFTFGATPQPAKSAQESASTPKVLFGELGSTPKASTTEVPSTLFGSKDTSTALAKNPFNFGGSTQPANSAQESASTPKVLFGGLGSTPKASTTEAPTTLSGSSDTPKPFSLFSTNTTTNSTAGNLSNGFNASTQSETATTSAPAFGNSPAPKNNFASTFGASSQSTGGSTNRLSLGGSSRLVQSQPLNTTGTSSLIAQDPKSEAERNEVLHAKPTEASTASKNSFENTPFGKTPSSVTSAATSATIEPTIVKQPAQNTFSQNLLFGNQSFKKTTNDSNKPSFAAPSARMLEQPPAMSTPGSSLQASKQNHGSPMPAMSATTPAPLEASDGAAMPKIPRATVPSNWTVPNNDGNDVHDLVRQLTQLNEAYRSKLAQLSAAADWSPLSKWHVQESTKLKKKIDSVKKQKAAAKGITGEETILSTKRKNDESTKFQSPTKKARGGDAPTTPSFKASALPSTTPKANPPSTSTSFFGGSFASMTNKAAENKKSESIKSATSQTGFRPNFGMSTSSNASGFTPNLGASTPKGKSSSGGFLGQFGGKTKEQLRAERMKKALNEFDSPTTSDEESGDFETKEQFKARWNREEDEREAAADAGTAFTFTKPTPALTVTGASNNGTSASPSRASTPGFFSSGIGSPAPSEGARSVLDTPLGAQTPSLNPFAKLGAIAASQQEEDDSDDEDDEPSHTNSKKRRVNDTIEAESESSETLEESMRRKKPENKQPSLLDRISRDGSEVEQDAPATKKPSLMDRMTRDNSEAENDASDKGETKPPMTSNFFNINGSHTPAPKKATPFFDFAAAAAASAPSKSTVHGGDQTFKPSQPIVFKPSTPSIGTPTPTPSVLEAAANPNTFGFLSAASLNTSRAATPQSDADASGTDSGAINEEEGQKHVEVDNSGLTAEERDEWDVLFEADQALARKVIQEEGKSAWKTVANGRLWILKNKANDAQVVVRLRMKSSQVPINHQIPRVIMSTITGESRSMVRIKAPVTKEGHQELEDLFIAFKAPDAAQKKELAAKFSSVYNQNVQS